MVPAHIAGIEVYVPREVRVDRIERTRPVEAVAACTAERTAAAVACRRQEDRVTFSLTGYFVTIYTVLCCPNPSALFTQFG